MPFSSPDPELDRLPELLRAPTRVLFERFAAAWAAAGGARGVWEARLGELARVFAASPFVAEYAIRNPGEFTACVLEPVAEPRTAAGLEALAGAACVSAGSEAAAMAAVRRLRNREMVRIAWRDILGLADLTIVMAELSALADAFIRAALDYLAGTLLARYGTPRDEQGVEQKLIVIGMGKLGGGELNFSSDIDLIFVFRAAGETAGGKRDIANQEYFDRLGKKLIGFLGDTTDEGFVYRVDMRLRPFGDSGPLTTNFAALEHYYLVHGRDWERYALIKGRAVTGDDADRAALRQILKPFVYRRYLDFGALEAVREMKALISEEVARQDLHHDVKRGAGGIREIEFIGQTFQLIRGGREPRLQVRPILQILAACADLKLLEAGDVAALVESYHVLRTAEHRLQEVHDQQTHELPHGELGRARLAYGLGQPDWPACERRIADARAAVRQRFAMLLLPVGPGGEAPEGGARAAVWSGALADADVSAQLAEAGFADAAEYSDVLAGLKHPRFLDRLSREARIRLDRLMPLLLPELAAGGASGATFKRLGGLLKAIARRSVYLALLADNAGARGRLIELYAASPWIAAQITLQPILLDELLDPRSLYSPPDRALLAAQLDAALANTDEDDLDAVMDVLRSFKAQQVLRVAASDVMGHFPIAEVSNQLSYIAACLLERALAIARADLTKRHGRPIVQTARGPREAGFAIVAYGKLGGLELGYGSDLDLVFIHDSEGASGTTDGPKPLSNDVFFTRLAQRIIHLIATRTSAGIAYELDMRLRPSGASGLLVTSLGSFAEYQHHSAWTWEHQALVRARGITGTPGVLERFEKIRREVLRTAREPTKLRTEIREMRERMRGQTDGSDAARYDVKHGLGGITDIEFMVQYAVLRWAAQHPALTTYSDNLRQLEIIANLEIYPREDCRTLHDAFFAYRAEVHRCALQEIDGLVPAEAFGDERRAVEALWDRIMVQG
ncbi:MAG: bifunctional [glutamate--ammonia ligase]-adenylyl-L-tyrosine phosphorylase/[glutamate--ammonia-ligase] adenylyltransferase [Gammaproteobacteria bacterium]|nr:bifunctional [glutamate--ammonia ligase]-adenylyl-L-tyrosine phosphorylase/[glutamate--ammonia-ligase] adenylyltransferase [Gammaproteobacteria bacterium]